MQKQEKNIKHRSHLPPEIRNTLSKLHLLIEKNEFIRGSFYYLKNTCGKKNCKCTKGQLHTSLYIQKTSDRKTKKALIPKARWKEVKEMNDRYKEILQLLEIISDYQWEHIRDKK